MVAGPSGARDTVARVAGPAAHPSYAALVARGAGDALADLVLHQAGWIHRRVETIDVLSAEIASRRVSVDLTVPAELLDSLRLPGGECLVPVATLRKAKLRNFDARAEDRAALPVVTRRDTALLASAAVASQAFAALGDGPITDAEARRLLEPLDAIVRAQAPGEGRARLEALIATSRGDERLGRLVEHGPTINLLATLAENYLLLVHLGEPDRRHIVKYAYESFMAITPSLRQTLGLAALEIRLSTPTAASGTSYHAEVVIPEELRAVRAALVDERGHEHDSEDNVDRVALYGARIPPRSRPAVRVWLRPERQGFPNAAAAIAVVVCLLLAAGGWFADLNPAIAGPPVTIALAGSALFAGAVSRVGEHRVVHLLYRGPRILLALVGLLALGAAGALAFGADEVETWWRVASIATACLAGILVLFAMQSRPTISRRIRRDRQV